MSTSLAEQLRRLAAPQTSILYDSKKRPSILFDPKEAAEKDRSTIYEIGYNGLMELAALNPTFMQFEQTLFDRSTMSFERSVESSEVNDQLNKTIKRFFYYLSPYFMLKPAHMCLEWLIRRYHIHQFNKNELLQLIFPYHETKMFVKCIQVLNFKNTNDGWEWLLPIQRPGVPLSRSAVLSRAATDPAFLKFICKTTVEAVKELDTKANTLQALFGFYTTSVVGALEYAHEIKEWHVSTILPSILKGMSSKVVNFCAAAYMIAAQLVAKTQLAQKLLDGLLSRLSEVEHARLQRAALSLVILMFQKQTTNPPSITSQILKKLVSHEWLPGAIEILAKQGKFVSPFCEHLISGCLQAVQRKEDNWQTYKSFLDNFLIIVHMRESEANSLIRCVLDNYCNQNPAEVQEDAVIEIDSDDDDVAMDGDVKSWYSGILQQLERQYPDEFDFVLKEAMQGKENISETRRQALKSALAFRLKSIYSEDNIAIYENLYHYNSHNRSEAVKYLVKNFDQINLTINNTILKDSLLDRLSDDEPRVLSEILKLPTNEILNVLGIDIAVTKLIEILYKKKQKSDRWSKVTSKVMDHLLQQELLRSEHQGRIILAIIPLLFPLTEQDFAVMKQILSSGAGDSIPFLKTIASQVSKASDALEAASLVEPALKSIGEIMEIEELLRAFSDSRDSLGFILLVKSAIRKDWNEELGMQTLTQVLEISQKYNLKVYSDDQKWYNSLKPNELPLELILDTICIIAERTKFVMPENFAFKCVFVSVFEFLLKKSFTSRNEEGKKQYSAKLNSIMKSRFPSFDEKLDFLANYFILDYEYEDEKLETQMRALRLFDIIVCNAKEKTKMSKVAFVKLLVALSNKVDLVRECALKALDSICMTDILDNNFEELAKSLLERHQEILLDHEQLGLILFIIIAGDKADKKMNKVLDDLVEIIIEPNMSDLLKAKLLNILKHINNSSMFKKMLVIGSNTLNYIEQLDETPLLLDNHRSSVLYYIISRIDYTTIKIFNEQPNTWNFIKKLLKYQSVRSTHESKPISIASTFMEVIDDELYNKLSEKLKCEFIGEIITALTFTDDITLIPIGNKLMKRISLNAFHIAPLLTHMKLACSSSPSDKRKQSKKLQLNNEIFNSAAWKKGITLLEVLQNKKKIENHTALISPLIDILKVCLEYEEQSNFEYAKQLVLSTLLQCCQKLTTQKSELKNMKEDVFRIDLVVQCIRASQNPQTHHHALLLLSQCASLFPEQVLHNIMDIFTFMGSSVVRQDDAFSFQLITKIIESIIPTLISIKSEEDQDQRVVSVMRVFSDIALDVPEHRRLPLYSKLIRTLDAPRYLWMFLCVLLEAHVLHEGKEKTDQSTQHRFSKNTDTIPKRVVFTFQLLKDFDVKIALQTCIALFDYIAKLPVDKDDSVTPMEVDTGDVLLFNFSVHTAKQLRHFKYVLVQVVSTFTSSREFIYQVAAFSEEETKAMKPIYQEFIIKILCYVPLITGAMEKHTATNQLQYWKVMLHHCYDVLESAISLLSPDMLLIVVQGLMKHRLPTVRKKVIEILIAKLQQKDNYFINCNPEHISNLLEPLNEILDSILDKTQVVSNETLYIQQSALIAVKLLSKILSVEYVELFKEILAKLTKVMKKHESIPKLILAAVSLAITEICSNLKAHAISQLSKFIPYIIEVLEGQAAILEEQMPDNVSIAIVTGVQKLVDTLPLFLGPYMMDIICSLVTIWIQLEKHFDDTRTNIVTNKLIAIWSKIATTVPLRVSVPVCDKAYTKLLEEEKFLEIKHLMRLLNECLANASSEDIQGLQNEIGEFYLNVFDFRTQNKKKLEQKQMISVEESMLDSFVSLVLKLSESSFRPLYQKVYDWAIRKNEEKDRAITYFLLSAKIAEALKSLYVLFAGDIIKDAADLLDKCNTSKAETDLYFPDDEDKNKILVENILKTLYRVFLHDSKEFINEHRFDILMQPIVDQLQNRFVLESEEMKDLLKSCISEMAHVTHNDILWKRLNYQILLKTRNNNADIRIAAMNCCVEIGRKLGEQFIPLLPETVPFIAELFEDEVEKVEKSCRRGVQELEKSLGISLQEYF